LKDNGQKIKDPERSNWKNHEIKKKLKTAEKGKNPELSKKRKPNFLKPKDVKNPNNQKQKMEKFTKKQENQKSPKNSKKNITKKSPKNSKKEESQSLAAKLTQKQGI